MLPGATSAVAQVLHMLQSPDVAALHTPWTEGTCQAAAVGVVACAFACVRMLDHEHNLGDAQHQVVNAVMQAGALMIASQVTVSS
jgi:hypothetical protein